MRRAETWIASLVLAATLALMPRASLADQGGVSFWIPGFFGSLAAVPLQPGPSVVSMYYHTTVDAGAQVARAKEFTIQGISGVVAGSARASLDANADIGMVIPQYTFKEPVLGGQATIGAIVAYGAMNTSLDSALSAGVLVAPFTIPGTDRVVGPFGISRTRFNTIGDSVMGFGDLVPQFMLRWNAGVHNYMAYVTGDIPIGDYDPHRLSNLGLGHWVVDAGLGYTYFNPQTGHEFSAVGGFTYNFVNPYTQYQNGVDFHLDWGASQFLTKQFQIGLVGYLYQQVGCDGGSGDHVGCFESRVAAVGAQLGYIIPMGSLQGYVNFKGYKEFESEHRPEGWNVWLTFVLGPAPPSGGAPTMTSMAQHR